MEKKKSAVDILFVVFAIINALLALPKTHNIIFYLKFLILILWFFVAYCIVKDLLPVALRIIGINCLLWSAYSVFEFIKSGIVPFNFLGSILNINLFFYVTFPLVILIISGIGLVLLRQFGRIAYLSFLCLSFFFTLAPRIYPILSHEASRALGQYADYKTFLFLGFERVLLNLIFITIAIYFFTRPEIKKVFG